MADPNPHLSGPPYLPNTAAVGGTPTIHTDIPVCAVFLLLYLASAISTQLIFQRNRRRKYKFLITWAMFIFSMVRLNTFTLRLVWAERQHNLSLQIAAGVFSNAGIVILYIINLLLALRLLRSTHPNLGWNSVLRKALRVSYVLLGVAFASVIAFLVTSYYTLNMTVLKAALWVERVAGIYQLIFSLTPVAFFTVSLQAFLFGAGVKESFGTRSMSSKYVIVGTALALTVLLGGFRFAMAWVPARPIDNPAWYQSKAAFYCIEFVPEVLIVYLYLVTRIDRRFWVPNGSNGPGDYSSMAAESRKEHVELELLTR